MKPTPDDIQTPTGGTLVLEAGTTLTNIQATSVYIREDSTVEVATVEDSDDNTYNYMSSLALGGLNWNTLKAGDLLFAGKNRIITSFKLTTGSALVNLL